MGSSGLGDLFEGHNVGMVDDGNFFHLSLTHIAVEFSLEEAKVVGVRLREFVFVDVEEAFG